MNIEGIGPAPPQLPVDNVAARVSNDGLTGAQGAQAALATQGTQGTQGATEDWTSFHSDSTSVQSLTSQALNSPEVRQGTVDALRQSVNGGQYQVNATRVAAAISSNGE
jgi:flagellar biosynthesis anti-sigma factor FlgM